VKERKEMQRAGSSEIQWHLPAKRSRQ